MFFDVDDEDDCEVFCQNIDKAIRIMETCMNESCDGSICKSCSQRFMALLEVTSRALRRKLQ